MPLMDGHRLTKLIKSDDKLKNIPVVIFSSLINEQMRARENHLVQMSSCQSRKSDCLYQKSINYSDNFLHFTLPLMGRRLTWAVSFFARAAMREVMESSQSCLHELRTLYGFSRSAATMPEHSSGISLLVQKGLSRSATRAKYWIDDNPLKRCYNHMVMKWRYLWFIMI